MYNKKLLKVSKALSIVKTNHDVANRARSRDLYITRKASWPLPQRVALICVNPPRIFAVTKVKKGPHVILYKGHVWNIGLGKVTFICVFYILTSDSASTGIFKYATDTYSILHHLYPCLDFQIKPKKESKPNQTALHRTQTAPFKDSTKVTWVYLYI